MKKKDEEKDEWRTWDRGRRKEGERWRESGGEGRRIIRRGNGRGKTKNSREEKQEKRNEKEERRV